MGLSLKLQTFSEFKNIFSGKPQKYISKQYKDVQTFGSTRQYSNVSDTVLDKYTPFRRLSGKKCTLRDSKYFIDKFEAECKLELPPRWKKMSKKEKVDFIVKNRYEKLVSNKIMNDIKDSRVENAFILSTDGKIKYHGTNNSSKYVSMPPELAENSITLHNHPKQFVANEVWSYSELPEVNSDYKPFSSLDYIGDLAHNVKKAYVVDFLGRKYEFIPTEYIPKEYEGLKFLYLEMLHDDFKQITTNACRNNKGIKDILRDCYNGYIDRIKKDGHSFRILNIFD